MDATITRIENVCLDMYIDFCISWDACSVSSTCDYYTVTEFDPFGNQRNNTKYNYEGINWGFSTCMTDDIKNITLSIQTMSMCKETRTKLRKKLDLLFSNPSCCDECCPLTVWFTDWDWEEYSFTAKAWSITIQDNYSNSIIVTQTTAILEACSEFVNTDFKECCWRLWSICGWQLPFRGCPQTEWHLYISYSWKDCWNYSLTIQAKNLVNPRFYKWWSYYWLEWTYNWELIFNTKTWVTSNGVRVSPINRQKGSNIGDMALWFWPNKVLLTADSWDATWCITYSNNWN